MTTYFKSAACVSLFFILLSGCKKETSEVLMDGSGEPGTAQSLRSNTADEGPGHVYTLNNATGGNQVIDYSRSVTGSLTYNASVATGGNGTGGGLGSQGAVILSENKKHLLAVNAGSNSISSFNVTSQGLQLVSTVNSGGIQPESLTQHEDLVYVVNTGGMNNISGFRLTESGMLQPMAGSSRPLSAVNADAAQVSFVNEGAVLVITEKATNKIVTYAVGADGLAGAMHVISSSSATPFGFAPGKNGNIFVTEAVGGAPGASVMSSYHVNADGGITLVKGSVSAGQTAACWAAIPNNGKYAYATNTGSSTVTAFDINTAGDVSVANAAAAATQASPTDAIFSRNSRFLYVLNGAGRSIQGFAVRADGGLDFVQTIPDLRAGTIGLAAN